MVLIDLRGETDDRRRELKLFWVWNSLLEYVRYRGSSGHSFPPLSVVIDELSFFVRGTTLNTDVIAEEFRELVQVRKRNANIWLTAATQEQLELPETMLRACLQMGSLMFGATTEYQTALRMVRRFASLDPDLVKHWRNVWGSDLLFRTNVVLEQEPVWRPLEEQDYLASRVFTDLPKGTFLTAISRGEGRLPGALKLVSTTKLAPGLFVNEELVARLKRFLARRDGIPVPQETKPVELPSAEAIAQDRVLERIDPMPQPEADVNPGVPVIGRRSPKRQG